MAEVVVIVVHVGGGVCGGSGGQYLKRTETTLARAVTITLTPARTPRLTLCG